MKAKFVVDVHNHKWGDYQKEFNSQKEAEDYIDSICADLNTYCFLYKLISINLNKDCVKDM